LASVEMTGEWLNRPKSLSHRWFLTGTHEHDNWMLSFQKVKLVLVTRNKFPIIYSVGIEKSNSLLFRANYLGHIFIFFFCNIQM